MCCTRRSRRGQSGVTLIELLIAVMILSAVVTSCIAFMAASSRMAASVSQMIEDERAVREALLRITRELRVEGVLAVGVGTLTLGNGVEYALNGKNLERRVPPAPFATFVRDIGKFDTALSVDYVEIEIEGLQSMNVKTKIKVSRGS